MPTEKAALRSRFPELGPRVDEIIDLEATLWSTGDDGYAEQLARTIERTGRRSRSRAYGELALARRDFAQGHPELALQRLERSRPMDPEFHAELDLFRADCHFSLGDGQAAMTLLSRMTGRVTTDPNLLLRVGQARSLLGRTTGHGSGPVAEALNGIYHSAGFGMIRRSSVSEPIGVENLSCGVREAEPPESLPLVTVVVLLPDSLPEFHADLSSLCAQSWGRLEILVMGGQASIGRLGAADRALLEDGRVLLVDAAVAGEPPLASATSRASGELLTTHRYGSWAHPQRVEAQATALLIDPALNGTVAHHMNVSSELRPLPLGETSRASLVGPDPYSAMVRTSGLAPEEVAAAHRRVLAGFSQITGSLEVPEDVAMIGEGVPLTLTLAPAWPPVMSSAVMSP